MLKLCVKVRPCVLLIHTYTHLQCTLTEEGDLKETSIRAAGFRGRFGAAVVAVRRDRKRVDGRIGDIVLQPGDQLVLDTGVCHCFF